MPGKNKSKVCDESSFADGDEEQNIKCAKCKTLVYYLCKNLPVYQRQLSVSKNYRGFICSKSIEIQ